MTRYLPTDLFWPTDRVDLEEAVLSSQEITSMSTAMNTLGPLERASARSMNVVTVCHVTEEGKISKTQLTLCGKSWGRKLDAKRIFAKAPSGSKLVIKNLDVSGVEFPAGAKSSLWISSNDFDWKINRSNNKADGTFTEEELAGMDISDWVIRAHIVVNEDPYIADVRWTAIPMPSIELITLPGDARLPGYPGIALSDGQANMAGVVQPETNCGLPFHPAFLNVGPAGSPICLPTTSEVREHMIGFWSKGTAVRGLSVKDWHTATKGPEVPLSDNGSPTWAWPSAPAVQEQQEQDDDEDSDPSEGNKQISVNCIE